jgi:predicted nucleic acid-binding protein
MVARVLDASVAIAWYLPEFFSREAKRWQQKLLAGEVAFLVPSLHFWEVGNVLRTYVRRGEIPADLAEDIYQAHLGATLEVSDPHREEVLRLALRYEATVYDAVYIALSQQRDIPLLTAEKTTTTWVRRLGSQVECLTARHR